MWAGPQRLRVSPQLSEAVTDLKDHCWGGLRGVVGYTMWEGCSWGQVSLGKSSDISHCIICTIPAPQFSPPQCGDNPCSFLEYSTYFFQDLVRTLGTCPVGQATAQLAFSPQLVGLSLIVTTFLLCVGSSGMICGSEGGT